MTLGMILETMNKNGFVEIYGTVKDEYYDLVNKVYCIEWHHSELLDCKVKRVSAAGSTVMILIAG